VAHSKTQFDANQITQYANKHTDLVTDIQGQLRILHQNVQTTLSGANSDMTVALEQVYTAWQSNVQKVVLDNLNLMADAMKAEANNQEMQDSDNTRAINQTLSPVGSFLGG
jgi:exonuclease V gamma subunit